MPRKSNIHILLILAVLFFLWGCSTAKHDRTSAALSATLIEQLQQMPAMQPLNSDITAKIKMQAGVDGKTLSSKGTLGIEQGEGIRIGITALGLFEVARLDFATDNAVLINKIGKEYAKLKYSDYGFLKQAGLDYNILQSVLMNEPFSPDGKKFAQAVLHMNVSGDENYITVSTGQINNMSYTFYFDIKNGELVKTEGVYNKQVRVICLYRDFEKLTQRSFPTNISLSIEGVGRTIGLELNLTNIKEGDYDFEPADISKYRPIEFSRILEQIK